MRAMTDERGTDAGLGWPQRVRREQSPDDEALVHFIDEHVLPRLDGLNRPKKVVEPSGLMWGAAKKQGVQSALVAEGFRVYMRNGAVIGGRHATSTSVSSDLAEQAQQTKSRVKRYFELGRIPVPEGRSFSSSDYVSAAQYAEALGWDVVMKPEERTDGHGVCTRISGSERFSAHWGVLEQSSGGDVLVEERRKGVSLRAFVAGERVVGVLARLPMFVVGDGWLSLKELAGRLLTWRGQNYFLRRMNPTTESLMVRLSRLGLDPESVPESGEVVVLQESPHVLSGALTVDVTEMISDELAELIVNAAWTIPGLRAGGVDLVVPSPESAEGAAVIGINSRASMQLHEYPALGRSRPVAGAVMSQFLTSGRGV